RMEAYLMPVDGGYAIKRDTFHRERFRKVLAGEGGGGGPEMWSKLAEVQCPTLVVRGARSDMFAEENVDKVKATNSNITLVQVDASHDVAGDAPDALIAEVNRFLQDKP
ncbi:MAG: alpha/beta hydrolase, partial [Alphaproteobacteria bacterium]